MSDAPIRIRRGPVRLGEDNEYVYKRLLKVSDEEYAALEAEGHIGMDYAPDVPRSKQLGNLPLQSVLRRLR